MDYLKDRFDIVILAGQSNASGSGRGPVEQEWKPQENIVSMDAAKEVNWTPEATSVTFKDEPFSFCLSDDRTLNNTAYGDLSLTFAWGYTQKYLQEKRKVLIIRSAVGGTAFSDGNWGVGAKLYEKMIEMTNYALSLNAENKVVAFLWHQGESEYLHQNPLPNFYEQLKLMLLDMRSRYGNIPVVAGDFVQDWKSKNPACDEYTQVIKKIVQEIGNGAFVETQGLLSNAQKLGEQDDIHFCRQALRELGERYFKAYETLR